MLNKNNNYYPFSKNQKYWIDGFFAGSNIKFLKNNISIKNKCSILVLYGTQTGNSESIAENIVSMADNCDLKAEIKDMDDIEVHDLISTKYLLIICSTYGKGEMPSNAEVLWEAINEDNIPRFEKTYYSVLALGDSSYDNFCKAGINWDIKLAELGAKRINNCINCNVDFENDANLWSISVLNAIKKNSVINKNNLLPIDLPSLQSINFIKYNQKNPFSARVLVNKKLSGKNSSKEIIHYELCLKNSKLNYEPGDVVNIIPENDPMLVKLILKHLKLTGNEMIKNHNIKYVLEKIYDIKKPTKLFLKFIINQLKDKKINNLFKINNKKLLDNYLLEHDIIDFIVNFKLEINSNKFISLLNKLQSRAYSISSSYKKHKNEVHLTINSVRYKNNGREYKGVASCYLADFINKNNKVKIYLTSNKSFKLPKNDSAPIIMIGPGTGIAPFRAFLEEREISKSTGDNWLIFGDRNISDDYIYQNEIENWKSSGLLTKLDLAFSRDQEEKIYVQTKMLENGIELFRWLERGSYFYVCGDATYMAKDVDKALQNIISKYGKLNEFEVKKYINMLKKSKRYICDIY